MLAEIALWIVAVQACGLAVLPLALRLFRALPDRGYGLAKPLGLLTVTYLIWAAGMLRYLEYRRSTALLILLLLAAGCWWRWGDEASSWLVRRRRLVGTQELLFVALGLIGAYIRAYNADIIGQEKFMDLAFFNGFLAASDLPAEDAWLAGYGMPYYTFGYLLLSVPSKLAGLPAALGYNLALVLVFALTFLLSSALVANLLTLLGERAAGGRDDGPDGRGPDGRAWAFGALGGLFVVVCGNLVGPLEVLAARGVGGPAFWAAVGVKNLQAVPNPTGWLPPDGGWWWHASRVIATIQPDGITEFPYFSFLLGDLHPHFTALPLLLLVAGLSLALLLRGRPWQEPTLMLPAALALGAPIAANTWDVATVWALYGVAALLVVGRRAADGERFDWRSAALAVAPIPLGVLLFSPYFVGYASQPLGLALVTDRTPLVSLLIIFGPFFALSALLGARLVGWGALRLRQSRTAPALVGAAFIVVLAVTGRWSAALSLALFGLMLAAGARQFAAWRSGLDTPRSAAALYLSVLAGLAFLILVGTDFVYIRDSFGTRMNTVFKLYYHVWLLLGLVGAPALALWLGRTWLGAPAAAGRVIAGTALAACLALGLVYPLAATWTKSGAFRGPATLDGSAFLERSKPADAAAIRWLAARPERPVVLEAVGGDYQEFARVSTFSGLPTLLGWVGHELQWRGQLDEYNRRQQDVDAVYQRAERDDALQILNRYRVRYVFVGSLEREKYGRQTEERLARWLTPVFRREDAVVFAVPREGEQS